MESLGMGKTLLSTQMTPTKTHMKPEKIRDQYGLHPKRSIEGIIVFSQGTSPYPTFHGKETENHRLKSFDLKGGYVSCQEGNNIHIINMDNAYNG